jgi:hypothetical protein
MGLYEWRLMVSLAARQGLLAARSAPEEGSCSTSGQATGLPQRPGIQASHPCEADREPTLAGDDPKPCKLEAL